jgi:hypothetical protein
MERRRIKYKVSFQERLADQAKRLRDQAETMPFGMERDDLVRRARQTETAHLDEWLSSPGLSQPK